MNTSLNNKDTSLLAALQTHFSGNMNIARVKLICLFITADLCLELVQKNGFALRFIPDEYLTLELCEAAAKTGTLLVYIPEEFYSENLILSVMANNKFEPNILDVPAELITKTLLIAYVKLGKGLYLDKVCKKRPWSKQDIIFEVVDDGVDWLRTVFSYHCSKEVIAYAKERYANGADAEKWQSYMEEFKVKLQRYE